MTVDLQPEQSESPSRSCENSLRHGYTGAGLVLPRDMRLEVDDRRRTYISTYRPRSLHEHDLIHQAALGMVRHLHLQETYHERLAFRSELARSQWPLLRAADALERSKRLAYNPPDTVAQLRLTLGGVEWLLQQWRLLLLALDSPEGWNLKLQSRAENLAGVAREHRHLDPEKVRGGTLEARRALVDRQIAELERLRDDPETHRRDEAERLAIVEGLDGHRDPLFERLARYEQRALRLHLNAIRELEQARAVPVESAPTASANADEPVVPPFFRRFTKESYVAMITDPENVRWGRFCNPPDPNDGIWKIMSAWIQQNGLKLDVETSILGLNGYLFQGSERQFTRQALAPEPKPARPAEPPKTDRPNQRDTARLLKEARKKADQDRKDKRKQQKLARRGHR